MCNKAEEFHKKLNSAINRVKFSAKYFLITPKEGAGVSEVMNAEGVTGSCCNNNHSFRQNLRSQRHKTNIYNHLTTKCFCVFEGDMQSQGSQL